MYFIGLLTYQFRNVTRTPPCLGQEMVKQWTPKYQVGVLRRGDISGIGFIIPDVLVLFAWES
jgi:hypothetical protein